MQENPDYNRNYSAKDDEIDLRSIFSGIGDFFTRIGNGIVYSIIKFRRASKRYKYILLIAAATGLAAAFFTFQTQKPFYQTSMLIDSEHFKGQIVESLIGKLNKLCEERNYSEVSRLLNVEPKVAQRVIGLNAKPLIAPEDLEKLQSALNELKTIQNEEAAKDLEEQLKMNFQTTYRIAAKLYSTEITDKLEQGIKYYLQNNEFLKKRMFISRENNLKLKEKLQSESHKLDSLKFQIARAIGNAGERTKDGSNNVILSDANNTSAVDVFKEDLEMFEKVLKIDRQLYLNQDVEILEGFTAFSRPDSPSLINQLFYGFLIGLGVGYLIVLFIVVDKSLTKIEKAKFTKAGV